MVHLRRFNRTFCGGDVLHLPLVDDLLRLPVGGEPRSHLPAHQPRLDDLLHYPLERHLLPHAPRREGIHVRLAPEKWLLRA